MGQGCHGCRSGADRSPHVPPSDRRRFKAGRADGSSSGSIPQGRASLAGESRGETGTGSRGLSAAGGSRLFRITATGRPVQIGHVKLLRPRHGRACRRLPADSAHLVALAALDTRRPLVSAHHACQLLHQIRLSDAGDLCAHTLRRSVYGINRGLASGPKEPRARPRPSRPRVVYKGRTYFCKR